MSATSFNVSSDGLAVAQRAAASASAGMPGSVATETAGAYGPSFMSGLDAALQAEKTWPQFSTGAGLTASPPVTSGSASSASSGAGSADPAGSARRWPSGSSRDVQPDSRASAARTTQPTPDAPASADDEAIPAGTQAGPARGDGGQASSSADTTAPGPRTARHRETATADAATTGGTTSATGIVVAPAPAAMPAVPPATVQPKPQASGAAGEGAAVAGSRGGASRQAVSNPPGPASAQAVSSASTAAGQESDASIPATSGANSLPQDAAPLPASAWSGLSSGSAADASLAAGLAGAVPARSGGAAGASSGPDASSAPQGRSLHGGQATTARPGIRGTGSTAASGDPIPQDVGNDSTPGQAGEQTADLATSVTNDGQGRAHAASGNVAPAGRSTAGASAVLVGLQDATGGAATPGQDAQPAGPLPGVAAHDAPMAGPDQSPVSTAGTAPSAGVPASDLPAADASPAEAVADLMTQASSTEGGATLTVSLHPKELGAVTVRLARAADGSTRITVSASTPSTLRSLVGSQDQLHAALDAASVPAAGRHLSFELAEPSVPPTLQHSHATTASNETHPILQEQSGGQATPDGASSRNPEQPGERSGQDQRHRFGPGHLGASVPSDGAVMAGSSGSTGSLTSRASAAGINITA